MRPRRRKVEPTPIGDSLPGLLRGFRRGHGGMAARVRAAWPGIVGEAVARRTRVVGLEGGVLRVRVASASVRQSLSVFRSEEVLRGLRDAVPEAAVERVSYRVGAVG